MRFGYACIALGVEKTTNRTCRLRLATPQRLRDLIADNLAALFDVLEYNARVGLTRFRISSEIVPFASHPINTLPWWDLFRGTFVRLGNIVRDTGQVVSMHPSHYTVLNAVDERVLAASLADLEWHHRFLSAMGLGPEHKLVLHIGGVYGDRAAAAERFVRTVRGLPADLRARLIVENEEHTWNLDETLPVAKAAGLPVVLDFLHHRINPGVTYADPHRAAEAAFATWGPADGTPKVHVSSQAADKRTGTHADDVDPADLRAVLAAGEGLRDFDILFECKGKDLAALKVLKQVGLETAAATAAV